MLHQQSALQLVVRWGACVPLVTDTCMTNVMTFTPAVSLSLSSGHGLTPLLPTFLSRCTARPWQRGQEGGAAPRQCLRVGILGTKKLAAPTYVLLFAALSSTFSLLWSGCCAQRAHGALRWDWGLLAPRTYGSPCSMSRHVVEGALSRASTIYWNLIALQCEVFGRHMLAQTPSLLANLGCCTNTPLSSTLNSGFPILDTPLGRALHTLWLTWTTATPQDSLPNLNSVFKSTSETRTDKKFTSSVHIQGSIFPLRLSAQPTSFLSEKIEYSKRTFFILLPPWFQIQALQ